MNNSREIKREYIQPDNENGIFKGSMIPSDDIEMGAMTKLKNQITKIQEEYIIKHKKSELPMYKVDNTLRTEDIEPPLYEVRMKNAREKKQEKYDKLMLKAF